MSLHDFMLRSWKDDRKFAIHLIKHEITDLKTIFRMLIDFDDIDLLSSYLKFHRINPIDIKITINKKDYPRKIAAFNDSRSNPDSGFSLKYYLLFVSARYNKINILRWLISTNRGFCPKAVIQFLAYNGNKQVLFELLNTVDYISKSNAIYAAALNSHFDLVSELVGVNQYNLHFLIKAAIMSGDLEFYQKLEKIIKFEQVTADLPTIKYCVKNNLFDILKYLPIDFTREYNILVNTIIYNKFEIFNYFISSADISYNWIFNDLIVRASKFGRIEFYLILEQNIDQVDQVISFYSCIDAAICDNQFDMLKWLINYKKDYIVDYNKYLKLAILESSDLQMIEWLYQNLILSSDRQISLASKFYNKILVSKKYIDQIKISTFNWLKSKDVKLPDDFISKSMESCNNCALEWGLNNGAMRDSALFSRAVRNPSFFRDGLIEIFHQHKFPYDQNLYIIAAKIGHLDFIKTLFDFGYIFDQSIIDKIKSISGQYSAISKFLEQNLNKQKPNNIQYIPDYSYYKSFGQFLMI